MSNGASPRSVPVGEIRRLGDDAVLIGVTDPESARRLIRAVEGAALNDQTRVTTPGEAAKLGIDFIVVGRPITHAPDPRKAALSILAEMQAAVPSALVAE